MTEKTNAELDREIGAIRSEIIKKADKSSLSGLLGTEDVEPVALTTDREVVASQAWVKKETESKLWESMKSPEILGLVTALTIAKLEITPFINLDPAMETWFKKRDLERNRFGVIWKVKITELQRRAKVIEDAELRLTRMESGIGKLQKIVHDTQSKVARTNVRITTVISTLSQRIKSLEKSVGRLESRSTTSRQQVRDINSSSSVTTATNEVERLRARVNLLTAALS